MFLSLTVSLALASMAPELLPTTEAVLPNGLRVIVHAWPEGPSVSLRLLVPAGAAADPPGRSGLAHLVEHLAFEGSAHAPGNRYDQWLAEAGGASDASTSHDGTLYAVTVPPGAVPLALFLESDRIEWLTPTAAALANQQAVVANERAESARTDQVRAAFAPLVWPADHPYARPVIGVPDELAAVTLADVEAFVRQRLRPAGATLVIAGPIDAEATLAEARRWFGELAGEGASVVPAALGEAGMSGEPDLPKHTWRRAGDAVRVWVPGDVDRVRLRIGWRTVDRAHPDRVALEIAGALLADALREDAVEVNAWSGRFGGELSLAADGIRPAGVVRRAQRAVLELAWSGPSEDALARIRARARAWELRSLQTAEGRASLLLGCADRTGVADCLPAEWAARERVDPAAIRRVVRRWLAPASRVLLTVAPSSRRRAPLPRMTLVAPP